MLIFSLLSCLLEVVGNSGSLLVGFKWSATILLKLCFWKLVFGCFLQPYGMQWRKRLQRFFSHVFLSQFGLNFFSFYFLRQRKRIQVTSKFKATLLVSPLLTWPWALFWLAGQSLCRRFLLDLVADNIWHLSRLKINSSILHFHIILDITSPFPSLSISTLAVYLCQLLVPHWLGFFTD